MRQRCWVVWQHGRARGTRSKAQTSKRSKWKAVGSRQKAVGRKHKGALGRARIHAQLDGENLSGFAIIPDNILPTSSYPLVRCW